MRYSKKKYGIPNNFKSVDNIIGLTKMAIDTDSFENDLMTIIKPYPKRYKLIMPYNGALVWPA